MSPNPTPARATPPGRVLRRELDARGWSQRDLAAILGRPEQVVSEIVRGRKSITPATALALSQALGTSAELWLNLEARYRLAEARGGGAGDQVRRRSQLYSLLPVKEIIRRGWISASDDPDTLEREALQFLRVASLDDVTELKLVARRTVTRAPDPRALLAWVRRVEQLAATQPVAAFDRGRLAAGMTSLLALSARRGDVAQIPALVAQLGVRLVIVPHLPGTYLDGAVLAGGGGPVVALTTRYDRLDSFWFTLLHELEHILQGHQGSRLEDLDADSAGDTEEQQADAAAAERLVSRQALDPFVAARRPYFSEAAITAFAAKIGRHPALVIGRLQHDGYVAPSHLRRLLPKVRDLLAPWIDTPALGQVRTSDPTTPDSPRVAAVGEAGKPPRVPSSEPGAAVLDDLRTHSGWHSRAAVLARTGLDDRIWRQTISALMADGLVERTGERRGTRYRADMGE